MKAQGPPSERIDPTPSSASRESSAGRAARATTWTDKLKRATASAALLRAAREIAIVTLGILIAFALNAWWEEHRERRQEQQHLRALASDFQQNVKQLVLLAEREERVAANSLRLLEVARGPEPAAPETVRSLMGEVFSSQRFEPVMGAYEALVNSAGLTLIRDDALRAALADFAARVSRPYGERFADELYFQLVHAFAGQLQFARDVVARQDAPASYDALLNDPKFQEYLALRHAMERDVGNHYRDLQRRSQLILERLQAGMR